MHNNPPSPCLGLEPDPGGDRDRRASRRDPSPAKARDEPTPSSRAGGERGRRKDSDTPAAGNGRSGGGREKR